MAKIVGAFGVSHGPLLTTPPEEWHQRAAFDRRNPRHAYRGAYYDFNALLAARGKDFSAELEPAKKAERFGACQKAVDEVARRFAACGADVAIVLGNDQHEMFKESFTPAFYVYAGETIENIHPDEDEVKVMAGRGMAIALPGHVPPGGATYPGAPDVANAIVDGLIERDFDVAISHQMPQYKGTAHGIPHAYGFIYRRVMNDAPPPSVPIFMNVGETRNQPRLPRLMGFGHALKGAIDALPAGLNVALVVSGGFTHFTVDEEFDRQVITAMQQGDEDALKRFPESWFWGNTCETKSWYPMVAAMNDYGRKMDVIDYVPCYRSEAGTGQAMIFASWS